jgi:hypothetical protein
VDDFVNELCEGIMEETLLNVGVIYITLYSGETEVERFPFVTHVRRYARAGLAASLCVAWSRLVI